MVASADTDAVESRRLLEVDGLCVGFRTAGGFREVVDGVSFHLDRGEVLGVVGESGSGKSVTALALARLLPENGRVTAGRITFQGKSMLDLPIEQARRVRGRSIGYVFQDPMTSLNPTATVGDQVGELGRLHLGMSKQQAKTHATDLLGRVGIPDPKRRLSEYPHQFSGGMRQRVMIAMAIACSPDMLIADEATTALDVTVQAQILQLLAELAAELGMATLMITHDIGVAATVCNRVNVMYAGQLVESAGASTVFSAPLMPYTEALMRCVPRLDDDPDAPLVPIAGQPPEPDEVFDGCRFARRCPLRRDRCTTEPRLSPRGPDHLARCWATEPDGWA